MRYTRVLCFACSFVPVVANACPLVNIAIRLAEKPEAALEGFIQHIIASTPDPVEVTRSFGPENVPDGHGDPLYWAVYFRTSLDGHSLFGRCNRIGRESDLALRKQGTQSMQSTISFADLINPNVTLQGSWPDPLPHFSDDAVARLDCNISYSQPVDAQDSARVFRGAFSDVSIKDALPNLFYTGFFMIDARHGGRGSTHRIDAAHLASNEKTGAQILISSWLLTPTRQSPN